MDKFTAGNGVTVWRDGNGRLQFDGDAYDLDVLRGKLSDGYSGFSPAAEVALREYFQAERDEELGRWRWPENPDYVVYPADVKSRVRVLRESRMGDLEWVDRGDRRGYEFCRAALAYFEAHPEPKPWDSAKPGEVWEIEYSNAEKEAALVTDEAGFRLSNGVEVTADFVGRAVNARKIWPESD